MPTSNSECLKFHVAEECNTGVAELRLTEIPIAQNKQACRIGGYLVGMCLP